MEEIKEVSEINIPKTEYKKIKVLHLVIFLLFFSLACNVFLILKTGILTGSSISENSLRLVNPSEKQPIDSNIGTSIIQYQALKPIIQEEIDSYNANGDVGVYLQDANTGAWLGINFTSGFTPASLLKLPVMMAILKKVERGEMNLNDKIELTKQDLNSQWGTLYQKGAGTKMSVIDLLEQMISFSDNTAKNALIRQLSATDIDSIFVHVGIPDPYLIGSEQVVSPRDYNRLFKSLYYSAYLSPKYSELALELTTDGNEESLIKEGVPVEVTVAHKFGIYDASNTLSDCGIVYHEKNPYFLCIMTTGLDYSKSRELIPKISKDIYDFVNKNSK